MSHVVRWLLCIRDPRDMLLFLTCKRNPLNVQFGNECTAVLGLNCHIRITPQPLRPAVWAQSFLQDGSVTTGVEGTGDGRHYCLLCRYYHPSQRLYTFITSMHLILSFKHNAMDAGGKSAWCQSYVRCRSTWWVIGIAVLAGPPHWPEGYSDEQDAPSSHSPVAITLLFLSCNRNPLDTADELRFMQPPSHSLIHVQCPPHVVAGALMLRHLWMTLRAPDQPKSHEHN